MTPFVARPDPALLWLDGAAEVDSWRILRADEAREAPGEFLLGVGWNADLVSYAEECGEEPFTNLH